MGNQKDMFCRPTRYKVPGGEKGEGGERGECQPLNASIRDHEGSNQAFSKGLVHTWCFGALVAETPLAPACLAE